MKKLKFIFNSITPTTLNSLIKIAKKVSNKTKKSTLSVIFDMLKCSFKYQAGFHDYLEFEFYLLNEKQKLTYLTQGKNNKIVAMFNDKKFWHILDNKEEFNEYFKDYIKRDFVDLSKCTLKEFKEFCHGKEKIMIKDKTGVGGKGIEILETKYQSLETIFNNLTNKSVICEELIVNHDLLNKLYPNSVNSIRIFTFYKDDKVYILQSILKIGNGRFVDNFSSGGMYTFLDSSGTVITRAIDIDDNVYKTHPITNELIFGFKVPYMNEAYELVKKASLMIKEVRYIGWDVAITNEGPVIIEGNSYPGIFQIKPSLGGKEGILPLIKNIMGIEL